MARIFLILPSGENRRLLELRLRNEHEVITPHGAGQLLTHPFDLGILDPVALKQHHREIEDRKKREAPLFLPFLLVASPRDVELCRGAPGRSVDEILATPVNPTEMKLRVDLLLRTRAQTIELSLPPPRRHAPTIDIPGALSLMGGKVHILQGVAQCFIEKRPQTMAALQKALVRGDADEVRRLSHGLKSAMQSLGAGRAAEAARRLEDAAGQMDLNRASPLAAALEEAARTAAEELEAWLASLGDHSSRF